MFLLTILFACGGSEPAAPNPTPPANPPTTTATAPAANPHASHSDHMAAMAATREALRAKLGPAYDAPVAGLDAVDPQVGSGPYSAHCASCHGQGGKGDGEAGKSMATKPADFTDGFHARYYSDAGRMEIIRNGTPDAGMPAFAASLDEQQILQVYAYVRSLRPAVQ